MEADSSMAKSKAQSPPVHLSGDLPFPFSETKRCFRLEIQSWPQHKFCVCVTGWQVYSQSTDCRIAVFSNKWLIYPWTQHAFKIIWRFKLMFVWRLVHAYWQEKVKLKKQNKNIVQEAVFRMPLGMEGNRISFSSCIFFKGSRVVILATSLCYFISIWQRR